MNSFDTTLLLIINGDKVLLAEKKRGFGKGKYNGIGGKVEKGETIEQGMIRETQEEINVTPTNYEKVGVINFDMYLNGELKKEIMHIFIATEYEGEISESEEMKPEWFEISQVPYDNMFEGDKIWLKKIFNGEKIVGNFTFDQNFHLLSYSFE